MLVADDDRGHGPGARRRRPRRGRTRRVRRRARSRRARDRRTGGERNARCDGSARARARGRDRAGRRGFMRRRRARAPATRARGSRGVRVGRRDGASRGVPGAVGGVDFGRVRGGAVRADDGGRRDRIHGAWTMRCDAINCLASWLADSGGGGQGRSYLRRDRPRCSDERRKK